MNALSKDRKVAIVGAGTMGAGIAQVAAAAGHPVYLYDQQPAAASAACDRIAASLAKRVQRGRMKAAESDAILQRIQPVEGMEALAGAALFIEAIVERLDAKQALFSALEAIADPEAILVSNTSSLSITAIGATLARPERLAGMHFFNPVPAMRLVEVISGLATDQDVALQVAATASAWGKTAVHARSTPGFIVNRVARPFYAEALRAVEEGATDPTTVDALLRDAGGFRMGPFELMDLIGNDVNYDVTCSMFATCYYDQRYLPSHLQNELVAAGRFGRKSGEGWYRYEEAAKAPAAAVAAPGPAPDALIAYGDLGVAEALLTRASVAGLSVQRRDGSGYLQVGSTRVALSDGRSATSRSHEEHLHELVVFDLAGDYHATPRIAIAAADQAAPEAVQRACGFFQALGIDVAVIDDHPGLIVLRTLCMLVSEACDAVHKGVCTPQDLDTAMQAGVNYPSGPLAWAEQVGADYLLACSRNLATTYGEDRYRPSAWLARRVSSGSTLLQTRPDVNEDP